MKSALHLPESELDIMLAVWAAPDGITAPALF